MQVHLFDCKSGNALQANLGRNKIQLCMLVLDSLRDTYWSAGVMYRLFDRAQKILIENGGDKGGYGKQVEGSTASPLIAGTAATDQENNNLPVEMTSRVVPEFDAFAHNNPAPMMFNDGMSYNNMNAGSNPNALDQILSPGFYLSDVNTQALFMSYTGQPGDGGLPMHPYDNL